MVYGYPGLFHNVETYLNERIDEVLSGSPGGVVHAFLQELEATLRLREKRAVQLVV